MDRNQASILVGQHPHWHHKFEIYPGVITPGSYDPAFMLDMLGLPANLAGKKILDIGASDGFFSAALHARGAEITALDYRKKNATGFSVMEKISGIKLRHVVANVYDIDQSLGEFDIVLLLGVIYHLPDIPSALWKVRQVCKGTIFLESYVEDFNTKQPLARYYEADSLAGDSSNFWAPNAECMEAMLRDCGFRVTKTHKWGDRALVEAEANASDSKMRVAYGTNMLSP